LEENHYYPGGLTMAGISDKAIKSQYHENKYRGNGGDELQNKEFSDGSGLESYDAFFRMYDPQIGRFWQQDPLAEASEDWSPYSFVQDNPVSFSDPLGLTDSVPNVTNIGAKGVKAYAPAPVVTAKKKSTSTAGAHPITAPSPTTKPPLRVVPGGKPTVQPIQDPIPEIPPVIVEGGALTVGLLLIPLGSGKTDWQRFDGDELYYWHHPEADPDFDPFKGHGNRKDNTNPHIVYAFGFAATDGKTPILKYGISDEYKNLMDRPENQLAGLRAKYGPTVMYSIYARTINRGTALMIEAQLVREHKADWNGALPREQLSPNP